MCLGLAVIVCRVPGERLTTVISMGDVNAQSGVKLVVTAPVVPNQLALFSGVKGAMYRAVLAKRNLDEDRSTPGSNDNTCAVLPAWSRFGLVVMMVLCWLWWWQLVR
jgi:hypothetical protein